MKKILILETASSYRGYKQGGSYLQCIYYKKLLTESGYSVKHHMRLRSESNLLNLLRITQKIINSDYVIGFGTPLLDILLQWICLFLGKKGLFCIDTIIMPISIINDHFKKRIFPVKLIISNFLTWFINKFIGRIPILKCNLINIVSCQYIMDMVNYSQLKIIHTRFLYPRVKLTNIPTINNKTKIVLYYGALYRGRGVLDLLHACQKLWNENLKFQLIILGWPVNCSSKKSLINEISKIKNKDIFFKTKVTNIKKYLRKASVVVLPFRYACSFQTPYTLLEPMANGIPVITTNVGSHGEWIKNRETGLICEKENILDIASRIRLIFSDYNLRNKIIYGAQQLIKERQNEKDILIEVLQNQCYET